MRKHITKNNLNDTDNHYTVNLVNYLKKILNKPLFITLNMIIYSW